MTKIEQIILKFIDEKGLLKANEKILVALSGGPDSVFLLHFLRKFQNRFKIELGAVHINHKLRGKNADADEEFCAELCQNEDMAFFSAAVEVKKFAEENKLSLEEAARKVRYAVFDKVVKLNGYNKIATAHNLSDNTETVLLNLLKGTGLKGIAGIPVQRGNIIRPLLPVSKKEILEYLQKNGIRFCIDESNKESIFERNYLRNEIIPLLKEKINPSVEGNIFNASNIYRNYINAFGFETEKYMAESARFDKGMLQLDITKITNRFLVNDVISKALIVYFNYSGGYDDFNKIAALAGKKNGKIIELKGNLIAFKEKELVHIKEKSEPGEFLSQNITIGQKIAISDYEDVYIGLEKKENVCYTNDGRKEYINGDYLEKEFVIRKWKMGDKFKPLGLKGTKKVSDFLNGLKLSRNQKENQLVLTQGDKIIWVIGLRIDERYKIRENTKKVLSLCLQKTL